MQISKLVTPPRIEIYTTESLYKKKQTSSVYDCTVKDVEYICNILRY
jgi:hypothetical protein